VLLLLSLMTLGLHQHTFILVLLLTTSTPEEGLPDPPLLLPILALRVSYKVCAWNYQTALFSFIRTIISDFIVISMLINVKHHLLFPYRFLISRLNSLLSLWSHSSTENNNITNNKTPPPTITWIWHTKVKTLLNSLWWSVLFLTIEVESSNHFSLLYSALLFFLFISYTFFTYEIPIYTTWQTTWCDAADGDKSVYLFVISSSWSLKYDISQFLTNTDTFLGDFP